jgi:hypothetical protein
MAVFALEDRLPLDPGVHQLIDLVVAVRAVPGQEQGPGVVRGLQQARHQQRLPGAQRSGPPFRFDPLGEPGRVTACPVPG